jgi:hypothetical protein
MVQKRMIEEEYRSDSSRCKIVASVASGGHCSVRSKIATRDEITKLVVPS